MQDSDKSISRYDRLRGSFQGIALFTKPSTIRNVEAITGRSETYLIETARHEELGDFIFVECVDGENGVIRLCLPPKAANAIASQRDALTARRRSIASRATARKRMENGEAPAFLRKKKQAA